MDEGQTVSCPECGSEYEVVTIDPFELKAVEAGYEDDEEESAKEEDDGDS